MATAWHPKRCGGGPGSWQPAIVAAEQTHSGGQPHGRLPGLPREPSVGLAGTGLQPPVHPEEERDEQQAERGVREQLERLVWPLLEPGKDGAPSNSVSLRFPSSRILAFERNPAGERRKGFPNL